MKKLFTITLLVSALFAGTADIFAIQPSSEPTPAIKGKVRIKMEGRVVTDSEDGTKAPVANATIKLSYEGKTETFQSDANGAYSITMLTRGNYTLTVEKEGFDKYSSIKKINPGAKYMVTTFNETIELLAAAL